MLCKTWRSRVWSAPELYKRDFQLTESDGQNWSKKSLKHPKTIQSYLLKNARCAKSAKTTHFRVNQQYLTSMYSRKFNFNQVGVRINQEMMLFQDSRNLYISIYYAMVLNSRAVFKLLVLSTRLQRCTNLPNFGWWLIGQGFATLPDKEVHENLHLDTSIKRCQ